MQIKRFTITGAVSTNGSYTIDGDDLNDLKGLNLKEIITIPGAGSLAPDDEYTGTVTDSYGRILTITARTDDTVESIDVETTINREWIIIDKITIALAAIGSGNTVTVVIIAV